MYQSINQSINQSPPSSPPSYSCATVASACFAASPYASKIKLIFSSATEAMKKLLEDEEKFDIVFLDADKENYICYYEVSFSSMHVFK